jgi:hypothetical protein
MNEFQNYIKYWDNWHKEWSTVLLKSLPSMKINEWDIPIGNLGNPSETKEFFPEPYWGNPDVSRLDAVFLNINPGLGGDDQNITISPVKNPILKYLECNNSYSETIKQLILDNNYPTTKWIISKRVNWLNSHLLPEVFNIDSLNTTIENVIAGDLIPWHTKNASAICKYSLKHAEYIKKYVLEPLSKVCKKAVIGNVIFAKGKIIADVLDLLKIKRLVTYQSIKNKSKKWIVFEYGGIKIIVNTGVSMYFMSLYSTEYKRLDCNKTIGEELSPIEIITNLNLQLLQNESL